VAWVDGGRLVRVVVGAFRPLPSLPKPTADATPESLRVGPLLAADRLRPGEVVESGGPVAELVGLSPGPHGVRARVRRSGGAVDEVSIGVDAALFGGH
jgi:hypothetical protein